MRQIAPSVIRTIVPWVVGIIVGPLATRGLEIPGAAADEIATVLVSGVYYGFVRIAETRGRQAWGWLLGLPKAPTYGAPAAPSQSSPTGYKATEAAAVPEDAPVTVEPYVGRHAEGMGSDTKADAAYHNGH